MNVNPPLIYRIIVIFVIICMSSSGLGQNHYHQFTKSDGLPSNECYDVYQDSYGLLWIATDRGLASFNGSKFNVYGIEDGLPNDVVLEIFPQKDGTIWCSTISNELFYFRPGVKKFYPYKYNHLIRGNSTRLPMNLEVGTNQELKFRPYSGPHLYRIDKDGNLMMIQESLGLMDEIDVHLIRDDEKYPYLKLKQKGEVSEGVELNLNWSSAARISRINDNVLVTSRNQIFFIDANDSIIFSEKCAGLYDILNSGASNEIFWISNLKTGLHLYSSDGQIQKTYDFGKKITSYYKDKSGGVWLTTQSSGLLYVASYQVHLVPETKTSIIQHVSINEKNNLVFANNVTEFFELNEDNKLIKSNFDRTIPSSQYYYFNKTFYTNSHRYRSNSPKYGSNLQEVVNFSDDRNSPPIIQFVTNITDTNGNFLIEHKPGWQSRILDAEYLGKNIIVGRSDSLLLYNNHGKLIRAINVGYRIMDIDIHDGRILCATEGKGMLIYNERLKKVGTINKKNGLKSNYINEIYIDGQLLWLGTRDGLAKVTNCFVHPKVDVIGKANGLISSEIFDLEVLNGRVYLGTADGLFYFDKKNWISILTNRSQIIFGIEQLLADGVTVESLLNLPFEKNSIEVEFELISFEQRDDISFRYKLRGLDNSWKLTHDRKIIFGALPPGEYELIIQPMFDGVPRNETIKQKISVLPPYYESWWFVTIIVVGIVLATLAFVRVTVIARNRGLVREILRLLAKRLQPKSNSFVVRAEGKDVRVNSDEILYVESNGNYLTIHTKEKKIVIREKISKFNEMVPDKLEYIRVRRSIIVRKDKITGKNAEVVIVGSKEIRVGTTYKKVLNEIHL